MNARNNHSICAMCGVCLILTALAPRVFAQYAIYTNKTGWFDPDGSRNARFSVVEAAACAAGDGGVVYIGAGTYREAMTIDWPVTLRAEGGMVTLGTTLPAPSSLRVISYNTHLFGDAVPSENCADDERATYFATHAGYQNWTEQTDVLALQEVWDNDYEAEISGDSGYYDKFYGKNKNGATQHSGLLMLTRQQMYNKVQTSYSDKEGWDWFANKGFLQATIYKDGYYIGIFNTHTQADEYVETRRKQMLQLANAVKTYRANNPTHPVIVLGDFNVIGESGEYHGNMSDTMGGTGATRDGMINYFCTDDLYACTSCADNEFRQHFDSDTDEFWRLDYALYAPSEDGRVELIPTGYSVEKWKVPDGEPDVECGDTVTDEISDHFGVLMEFDIHSVF